MKQGKKKRRKGLNLYPEAEAAVEAAVALVVLDTTLQLTEKRVMTHRCH